MRIQRCCSETKMKLIVPALGQQDNLYDCGVYVCRYIYAVHMLQYNNNYNIKTEPSLQDNELFIFDSIHIEKLRRSMKELLQSMSIHYNEKRGENDCTYTVGSQ